MRVTSAGATPGRTVKLYAYPRIASKLRVAAPGLTASVVVRGPRSMNATGRRIVGYLGRVKAKRYDRLASARPSAAAGERG